MATTKKTQTKKQEVKQEVKFDKSEVKFDKSEVKFDKSEVKFDKSQILASQKYVGRRDALGAILNEGDTYSLNEVDSLLEKFMKRKVD